MGLPHIDVHSVSVDADPQRTWGALNDWLAHGSGLPANGQFTRLLGCDQVATSGVPGEPGSTVPGFRVATADPPRELSLEGAHRFSDYELRFQIEPRDGSGSRLSATTNAAFPGLKGELYKTVVIRSRAHRVLTRAMLHSIARRAEDGKITS